MPQRQDDGLIWKTSTYTNSGTCVEWARPPGGALVRDTKDRPRAVVAFQGHAWQSFVNWVGRP